MRAEQFISDIRAICQNAKNCDSCVLNSATDGICMIDKMDAEKLIMAVVEAKNDLMMPSSEGGSVHDFDKSKVEQAFCIETAIDNWEVIAEAVNASLGEDNSPIDLEAEYRAGYLRVFDDGVVMLYL